MIGQTLGPYELIEEVGRGGMAAVYRARQKNMNRFVAVKVIYRSIAADAKALDRFKREAELIARLEHPHILPVYDYNGENDPPYIVMRYLPTGTLRDVMAREQLPAGEIAYLLGQIASALDYAHKQGIVHRDIKPTNIMIDGEGNAFLTDFGIARMMESSQGLTATGLAVGTPGYMAPEQGMGQPIDARADIYALGVMVFELLAGQMPYTAETPMAVILKHISEPVPDITKVAPQLPAGVGYVIQKAMSKRPEDRYSTSTEFSRAFSQALGGAGAVTPNKLQAVAERTIRELEAARANATMQLPGGTTPPPNKPPTGGTRSPEAGPPSGPIQSGQTGTQTAQVARGAALGAGAVILVIALVGLGAFLALQVINGNANATATGQAIIFGGTSTQATIQSNATSTAVAIALAGTTGAQTAIGDKATPSKEVTKASSVTTVPTRTEIPSSPTHSATPSRTFTPSPIPPTATPVVIVLTATPLPSLTPTQTLTPSNTPTNTLTPSRTFTPVPPTATQTSTPVPTSTATPTPSATPTASNTPTLPPTSTPIIITATPLPNQPTGVVPTIAPTATATTVPGILPYVTDYESDDALKLYDYDSSAWKLLPDSGNVSLVGTGGLQKPIVVLGKAQPEWTDTNNRNLLLTVSINVDSNNSVGRIIFRYTDKGYYALEIAPGSLKLTRGPAGGAINRPGEREMSGGRVNNASIRSGQFYNWLIWTDDSRVYVYQDNRLLLQVKDSADPLPGGQILFQTLSAGNAYPVRYDNLKVQRPNLSSQHFAGASWPTTWDRSNLTDATIGGDSSIRYIDLVNGSASPKTGVLTNFILACRLYNQEGGFEMRVRETTDGYYLMRFDAGNMTLFQVGKDGKEQQVQYFQNFYQRGFFQEFTFEFVEDRITIISNRTLWSQVVTGGPRRGTIQFTINRPKDGVRITDFLIAETARSATESAQWAFDKITEVESRNPQQLLTEYYDFFVDKFAKQSWWDGGSAAPGEPKFDNKASREHQQYLEFTYAPNSSYRLFKYVQGAFLLFGTGSDKTKFFNSSDVYVRVNVRLDKPGTAYVQARTTKTVGGSGLSGYQLSLTRNADNSYTVIASELSSTGNRTEYYHGPIPVSPGADPDYSQLLVITYQDKVAFFINGRFLAAHEDISILGGTVAIGVEQDTVARFDNFQLRDVSPETR